MAARVIVVGAGPAGIAARGAGGRPALRPVLIDEAARARRPDLPPPAGRFALDEARCSAPRRPQAQPLPMPPSTRCADRIDYRPDTLVWNIHGRRAAPRCAGTLDHRTLRL